MRYLRSHKNEGKKSRDLDYVKCVKSDNQNVLVKEIDIKEMQGE